jgi:hypothetical protein
MAVLPFSLQAASVCAPTMTASSGKANSASARFSRTDVVDTVGTRSLVEAVGGKFLGEAHIRKPCRASEPCEPMQPMRATFCHAGSTPAEKCKTSGSSTRATKSQRHKSTAFARTTSLYVGRQVTFSPGADVLAAALTEGIYLVSTA